MRKKLTILQAFGFLALSIILQFIARPSLLTGNPVQAAGTATFQSLVVEKSLVLTDDKDVQTASVTFLMPHPNAVDDLRLRVHAGSEQRLYFGWTLANGFAEISTPGNGTATLLSEASERVVNSEEGTVTFHFRWTTSPAYGGVADNDISYVWKESANDYTSPSKRVDTNFSTELTPSAYSSFESLTVDKLNVYANDEDVQTISLKMNVGEESNMSNVLVRVRSGSVQRLYAGWTPNGTSNGLFAEINTPSNAHITLLPEASERVVDTANDTVTYNFRFTMLPSYGAVADNDVSYSWTESANNHFVDWTRVETNYTVSNTTPPPTPPPAVASLNHILLTGQSLSIGFGGNPPLSTTQPYNNFMLTSGALVPLVESPYETIRSAMAYTITFLDPTHTYQTIATSHGVSSQGYATLKKGSTAYNNSLTRANEAKTATLAQGKAYVVRAVSVIHGETDHVNGNGAAYQGYLEEWQRDYETDLRAISGQTESIPLFTDQFSAWNGYTSTAISPTSLTSQIPLAQLAAAESNPGKIILVGPKYFLSYSDRVHLNAEGYRRLGEYYGKVYKKVIVDGQPWTPLSPKTITRSGNVITATFNVPQAPLIFDTTHVLPKSNMGFEFFQEGGSPVSITNVAITAPDTVTITLSSAPNGDNQRLRYAYTGTRLAGGGYNVSGAPGGNLHDSDTTPSQYTNTANFGNYLWNWAVTFDKPVTVTP